ncbi:Hypothetical_protein [Hexamita inflata]|uniref:Hypothetical_protein n=1 Tax=Hexamita inflata TaxID=28002 RepID=A0AA86NJ96_9EUKA|nr:Hypothetical protein HINF_LOCUS7925 [Hexamita inflata]
MKRYQFALILKLISSILVLFSFNIWLVIQVIDYDSRSMNTKPYFTSSLTSYILVAVYILLFILANIILCCDKFTSCACCCVCSKYSCCLHGQYIHSLQSNKSIIQPKHVFIRTLSLFLTAFSCIGFIFSVLVAKIYGILAAGVVCDLFYVFQFVFKTKIDFKIFQAVQNESKTAEVILVGRIQELENISSSKIQVAVDNTPMFQKVAHTDEEKKI